MGLLSMLLSVTSMRAAEPPVVYGFDAMEHPDPANEGVKVRRRVNRHMANVQKANVYIDGRIIPDAPWYVCDLPVPGEMAFRDSDYEIPAKYAKGKTSITIKLEHVEAQPANSNNEYYYWVHCYGRTPFN